MITNVSCASRGRAAVARGAAALVAVAVAAGAAACSKEGDVAGIRSWQLGKTVRGDFKGVCPVSDGMAWCVDQRPVDLGGQAATIQLYFAGESADAPLVEIAVDVRACRADRLESWLVHTLGEPAQRAPRRLYWRNGHAFIAAQLPASGFECGISFVSPKDAKRIDELKAPAQAAPAAP